ncbi:acetyltransferase [Candidatus Latescibacterota bacterium]
MKREKLAIIGGGGHAKEVIEVAETKNYEIIGIFAQESKIKKYPLLGYLDELKHLKSEIDCVHVAIGYVNQADMVNRKKLISLLEDEEFFFATIISSNAYISESAKIGKGVYISHFSLISSDVIIGDNTILNYSSIIAHDTIIGKNSMISPKSFLGGNSEIKNNVLIGTGALIMQGCTIGNNCFIGMGSVVREDVNDNCIAFGNPLKIKRPE